MIPPAERKQCPFCLKHVRLRKGAGEFFTHTRGRSPKGKRRECPGSGKTKEQAKAAKLDGIPVGAVAPSIRPEEIF